MNCHVSEAMHTQIVDLLHKIELQHEVRVLYACESGSRAWGFPSKNSDYDVRFLYLRPKDWYLSVNVEHSQDVIELPLDDTLDLSGWDLRKALQLLRKSNPSLHEWLRSPTHYQAAASFHQDLQDLAGHYYSLPALHHHYLRMAKGHARKLLQERQVRLKKYLYALRALLAVLWIEAQKSPVPIAFATLVEAQLPAHLKETVDDLLAQKDQGWETDLGPSKHDLNTFLDMELARLEHSQPAITWERRNWEPLNRFFRTTIERHGENS